MQDAFGRPQRIVVLGGSSDLGRAILERLCASGGVRRVVLAARGSARRDAVAAAVTAAGAESVGVVDLDAENLGGAAQTVARCFLEAEGGVDLVVVAVGALGDQARDEDDAQGTLACVVPTYAWPVAALAEVRRRMVQQATGRILVLSSVAGVRVRRANYVYGGAKAGLDQTCLGIAESLRGTGVKLQVLRPGFVRTTMTEGMAPPPLSTGPEAVAAAAVRGLRSDATVLWSPPAMRYAAALLRLLPAALFRRLPG